MCGSGQVTRLDAYEMLVEADDLSEDAASATHSVSHEGRLSATQAKELRVLSTLAQI